jgi:hypothetical protein
MKVTVHNVETGEVINRNANTEEMAQAALDATAEQNRLRELEAKLEAKTALLDRLGITADEAALLLS